VLRRTAIQIAASALAAPCAAQLTYVSPGIGYTSQTFDGRRDAGFATELTAGAVPLGLFLQLDFYGSGRWRLGLGAQASLVLGLEAGASFRFEEDGEVIPGLHLGPHVSAGLLYVGGRFLFEKDRPVSTGLAALLKIPNGPVLPAGGSGRPLRDENGTRTESRYVVLGTTGPAIHVAAGRWWLQNALAEHAAITAFVRLGGWLGQLGAPAELIARCLQASEEEARHAEACFALAGRLLGQRLAPVAHCTRIGQAPDLASLAVMNLTDGRYAEGVAAREAESAFDVAIDAQARRTLAAIAAEEASHARLADDIEAWLRQVGGSPVEDALQTARHALVQDAHSTPELPNAPEWGVTSPAGQRAARVATLAALFWAA
jgi:hypothetical protein